MAKQNVSFIERHLEKFVVGLCGAVFLGVVYMYLIADPHVVEVGGTAMGPAEFYGQFRQKGETALSRMRSGRPDEDQKPINIDEILNPRNSEELPDRFPVVFGYPSPTVPEIGKGSAGVVELAQVIAPNKPQVTSGRSAGQLPPTRLIRLESGQTGSSDPVPQRDYYWVTVSTTIDRKKQREIFEAAGYGESRLLLTVLGFEAERQELLPDGNWGEPERVTTYAPVLIEVPDTLRMENEDGQVSFSTEVMSQVETFRKTIDTYDKQDPFLRPPFQEFVEAWWEWTVPRTFEGLDGNMEEDYGVAYAPEDAGRARPVAAPPPRPTPTPQPRVPRDTGRGGRGAPGGRGDGGGGFAGGPAAPAAPAGRQDSNTEVIAQIRSAEELARKGEYIQAGEVLTGIIQSATVSDPLKQMAQKKLDEYSERIEQAIAAAAARQQRLAEIARLGLGPDIDPVWVNDITATPGKTYRYRLRILALNQFAAAPSYLKNPEDAARLVLRGQWSEWSEPVQVKPDRQLFATGLDTANPRNAKLILAQWAGGEWKVEQVTAGPGDPIRGTRQKISYDGTVVEVDPKRPYVDRVEKRDKTIELSPGESAAVVLVDSRGETHEHFIEQDKDRHKAFVDVMGREKKLQTELAGNRPNLGQPRNRPGIGGPTEGGFIPRGPAGDFGGRDFQRGS